MNIGIIGNGFVGQATNQLECNEVKVLSYDIDPRLVQSQGTTSKRFARLPYYIY